MRMTLALAGALLALGTPLCAEDAVLSSEPAAWSAPEREQMVEVEGGRVWVRINGNLDAPEEPVIMIHGGPGGTHMTFGNLLGIADERAVILYDQLDSGKSDHPEDPANWRVERFVSELESIREALGIARWHVVGHSWGSAIALEYTAAHPEHVASTVLGGTFISTPHWIMGTNLLIRDLPDAIGADIIACESETPPDEDTCTAANRAFYRAYNGRPDRPAPSARQTAYRAAYGGEGFNPVLYNAMWGPSEFRASGSLVGFDATGLLAKVDGSRVLFMVGQYDEAQLDQVRDFVRLTPGAELAVIPGGSHAYASERPRETEALLRGWMERKDVVEVEEPSQ